MFQTRNIVISLTLLISVSLLYALPSDVHDKVHIIADGGNTNYKTGITLYEGHVKIDQGTSHIIADRVIMKRNKKHQIEEAIAYGLTTPAHYITLPQAGEAQMHAYAKVIKFYPLAALVSLNGKVLVIQGENRFEGEVINYNNQAETIDVPKAENGRAVIVYNPD